MVSNQRTDLCTDADTRMHFRQFLRHFPPLVSVWEPLWCLNSRKVSQSCICVAFEFFVCCLRLLVTSVRLASITYRSSQSAAIGGIMLLATTAIPILFPQLIYLSLIRKVCALGKHQISPLGLEVKEFGNPWFRELHLCLADWSLLSNMWQKEWHINK